MKAVDRWLQQWRIRKALGFVPLGARILDVGCGTGALLHRVEQKLQSGVGIDPELPQSFANGPLVFVRGSFPDDMPTVERFDCITMLAVLEHVPDRQLSGFVRSCRQWLRPGGKIVLTVPAPAVDRILRILRWWRLIEGLRLDQHHGFEPRRTPALFTSAGFSLAHHSIFQLGLNHLFVFSKSSEVS